MNTIEEIKNQVAVKLAYINWSNLQRDYCRSPIDEIIQEIAQEYAKQMCEKQREACDENFRKWNPKISTDDILLTPNVLDYGS